MTSSSVCSNFSRTLEVTVPDREFDAYLRLLSFQRRNSQPANMARDSDSGYSSQHRRSSYSSSHSASSRSRASGGGGAVQPPSVISSETGCPSVYASSNATGFRTCLDVPGSPPSNYFSSGASKIDRRRQYAGQSSSSSVGSSNGYPAGNEVVRYTPPRKIDTPDDSDNEDNVTVTPQDSISQVSSNRSMPSTHARQACQASRSSHSQYLARPGPSSYHRNSSFWGGGKSEFEGEQVYDRARGYSFVERWPRGR